MATATQVTREAHTQAISVVRSFKVAERMRIQEEMIARRDYTVIGKLTAVLFEGNRSIRGLSQAKPRYYNDEQRKQLAGTNMAPFSLDQLLLWSSLCLDWLTNKNSPILAISRDKQDLLLPYGLTPLPPLPDPRWQPKCASDIAPRIPQLLTGCPVFGDRVREKITETGGETRGRVWGLIQPVVELSVMLSGVENCFCKISGDTALDGTKPALLINDENPEHMRAHFIGKFRFGG